MTRADQKTANRERILAAARNLIAEQGYDAATMRDIAGAAGLSTGAIFSNFQDKEEIYRELYGHPPVTPEQGRVLRKLVEQLSGEKIDQAWLVLAALAIPDDRLAEAA